MAVVQSSGQLERIGTPWAPWSASRGITVYSSPPGRSLSYADLYRQQPAVRTVVDFLARNVASLSLHVYRRISDTERERLGDHPLAVTVRRPSLDITAYDYWFGLVADLCVYGSHYSVKLAGPEGRLVLQRIPPDRVSVRGSSWIRAEAYRVQGGRGYVDFPADRVWCLHNFNPDDGRLGLSPLETLRSILAEEEAASEFREHYWRNAARVEGVIERPVDAPDWSDAARRRFREEWQSRYAGPEGSGLTPVLEEGMQFKATSFSARDSEFMEGRKLTREQVAAAYQVPQAMVGLLDQASYNNIEEQHKMLYSDCLGPWLKQIEDAVELHLLPEFDDSDDVYVEYNIAEKLKGSFDEQTRALQSATGAPWLTRNEARARMNLPPVAEGDSLVVPLNVMLAGGPQASPNDSVPPSRAASLNPLPSLATVGAAKALSPARRAAHVRRHRTQLERFFTRQRQALASALARKAGPPRGGRKADWADVWDADRWNGELADDLLRLARLSAEEFGTDILDRFGDGDWDPDIGIEFLRENARIAADNINATTREALESAGDDRAAAIAAVFSASALSHRIDEIAQSRVTLAANFGAHEAAKSAGVGRKRWVVTSSKPRPAHAALANQTVPIGEAFSNGARWPGDPSLPLDQRAGCTCEVEFLAQEASLPPMEALGLVAKALLALVPQAEAS